MLRKFFARFSIAIISAKRIRSGWLCAENSKNLHTFMIVNINKQRTDNKRQTHTENKKKNYLHTIAVCLSQAKYQRVYLCAQYVHIF